MIWPIKEVRQQLVVFTAEFVLRLEENFRCVKDRSPYITLTDKRFVDASLATQIVSLQSGEKNYFGLDYLVIKTDASANTVTIIAEAPDTIMGAASIVLSTQYQTAHLTYNAGVWYTWYN